MKAFLQRLVTGLLPGGSKKHMIDIACVIGLSPDILLSMRESDFEKCEEAFLAAIEGKHGCAIDWKASEGEIREGLAECATPEELDILRGIPLPNERTASKNLVRLAEQFNQNAATRSLILLESFGDFVIVLLVPTSKKEQI